MVPRNAEQLDLTVGLSVDAPRQARHLLAVYRDQIEESVFDDLCVLTSELVTNAVQHSGRPRRDPIAITVSPGPDVLRVDVTDGGACTRPLRVRSFEPPSGLRYLELMSDRWGSEAGNDTCRVWFEIDVAQNAVLHHRG